MTVTKGELEPEFVSYATLRRPTFCFKGMKKCEFDHDWTDSRAPPFETRASHCGPCNAKRCTTSTNNKTVPTLDDYFKARSYHLHGKLHEQPHIPTHGRLPNCTGAFCSFVRSFVRSFACTCVRPSVTHLFADLLVRFNESFGPSSPHRICSLMYSSDYVHS